MEKLNQAKEKLQEFYKEYPYLNSENNDTVEKINELNKSFQQIISVE